MISKPATMSKESAFFAFPFAMVDPVVRVDATGSVTGTDVESVPGGATHMRAVRRWIALLAGDLAIAWATQDAPLVQVGSIVVPYVPFPRSTPSTEPATIYSWIHGNLWDTNFPSQQAFEMTFHYSVAAARAADPDAASAFAARCADVTARPLAAVLAPVVGGGGPAADSDGAVLRSSDDRVRIVGLTVPDERHVLVRLQSCSAERLRVAITTGGAAAGHAWQATYLGEPLDELVLDDGAVHIEVGPFGTAAVLFELPDL